MTSGSGDVLCRFYSMLAPVANLFSGAKFLVQFW